MARQSHQIEWMPAYKSGDERIIKHYQRAYNGCNPQKAAFFFKQDREAYFSNPQESRIKYNKGSNTWSGPEPFPAFEKLGLRRPGANPNSLRYTLDRHIGDRYLTRSEVCAILEMEYGEALVESKFKQARNKGILQQDKPTRRWHLWCTTPPNSKDFGLGTGDMKRDEYVRLYGLMPRGLKHKPGEAYVAGDSQVLKWMGEKSGNSDLDFLEADLHKARRYRAVVFDNETDETLGILTYLAEAKSDKAEQEDYTISNDEVEEAQASNRYLFWNDNKNCFVVGSKRKELRDKAVERIEWMERTSQKKAAKWISEQIPFTIEAHRFIEEAIDQEILFEHDNGDLEGFSKAEYRTDKEEQEKKEAAERRQAAEERRKAEEQERQARREALIKIESEKLKALPANSDYTAASDFIVKHCVSHDHFTWPEILQSARSNGVIVQDPETGKLSPAHLI